MLDGGIQHLPILSKGVIVLAGLLVVAIAGLVVAGMRTSEVPGARIPDVAPQPPTELVAEGVAADLIELRWAPSDRAELYRVQRVDEAGGAVLGSDDVKDGATAFGAKVEEPLTRACYQVVAVRGPLASGPGAKQCATSRDGRLPPPTNVQAAEAPGGFNVSWTDNDQNEHTVLVDGAPVGAASPAGVKSVTVPVPAGRHCITVVARRGQTLSSPPSDPPACVVPTAPPSAAATAGPGPGVRAVPQEAPAARAGRRRRDGGSGRRRCGWRRGRGRWRRRDRQPDRRAGCCRPGPVRGRDRAALPGAGLADTVLQQVRGRAPPTAQLVPVTQLPQLRFVTGLAIVVPASRPASRPSSSAPPPAPASRPAARRSRQPRPDHGRAARQARSPPRPGPARRIVVTADQVDRVIAVRVQPRSSDHAPMNVAAIIDARSPRESAEASRNLRQAR